MSSGLYAVVGGLCSVLQFGIYLAFLITTLTAVRARRPDAYGPLAAGAGTLLVDFLMRVIFGMLLPLAMRGATSGIANFYVAQSMLTVMGTVISIVGWTLLIIGVIRIASPPREQNFNRAPGDY